MRTIERLSDHIVNGFIRTKAVLSLCALLVFLALVPAAGGSLSGLFLTLVCAVFYILLPGRFWRRLLRLDDFIPRFAFPLTLLLGVGTLAVVFCVGIRLELRWLVRVFPPLCALAGCVLYRDGSLSPAAWQQVARAGLRMQLKAFFTGRRLLLILLTCALLFVYGWCGVVKYTHATVAGQILPNQDFLWNVGNAESFLIQFPPEDLRFYDVRLTYHYLTEMITAALSLVSGLTCYDILAYYQQPLTLCALVACLYSFGRWFFRRDNARQESKALLVTFAPFLFACASLWAIVPNGLSVFWVTNITHLVTNINSQATLIIFLTVFSALFLQAAEKQFRIGLIPFAATAASFVLLCFAKGPAAAIVACAALLTVIFLLLQKKAGWQGAVLALTVGGMFLLVYLTMFSSGPNTSVAFSLSGTLLKGLFGNFLMDIKNTRLAIFPWVCVILIPVQAVLMHPAAMPLVLAGAAKDLRRLFRLDGDTLFASACAAGGTLAYFLYDHPSMSQIYFFLLAVFFLNLLAVRQLDALPCLRTAERTAEAAPDAPRCTRLRRCGLLLTAVLATVGLLTAALTYVNLCGSGLRQFLRNYDIVEKYPYTLTCVLTADDESAALWLRENTDADVCMFATNRIHTGARKEGVSNVYSSLSARQGFMEGYQYAETNMGVSLALRNERLSANNTLFSADTDADTVRTLCAQYGITHLIFSEQMDGSEEQLASFPCVYRGTTVRVYEIFPGK